MTVIVPTLRHERRLWNEGLTRVAGVDEVGVAPTCGAVVAAAVIMKPGCHRIPGVRARAVAMLYSAAGRIVRPFLVSPPTASRCRRTKQGTKQ